VRRSRAEVRLREEQALLQAVVGASRDAVVLADDRGRVRLWNPAAEAMFGYAEAEMLGQPVHERLAPSEEREAARAGLAGFALNGRGALVGPATLELEAVRRDGSRLPVELALAPVRLDGRWHAVGSMRDIADRKRTEALVSASEQRFRDVSEAVSEFIWEVDAQGRYTFLTEDVAAVLGYTAGELLGRRMFELMPEDEATMLSSWFAGLVRDGQRFSKLEHPCRSKGGEIVWLNVSGVPLRGPDGAVLGYRGAAMDVTDRRRSEQALMEREETIRAMSEASHDAIVMVDGEGRVSFWNRAAERIFGYSAQEATGREVHELVAPEPEQARARTGLSRFARTGAGALVGKMVEMTARRKDGGTFPLELSVAAFRVGGQWRAVATLRDITRRKQWQQRLEELATTDELTGVHNRRNFLELARRELERSRRYGRPLSLLMLDVDHFKKVNDTWGHDAGDEVLRHLARTCQAELREVDVFGRIGGEEFAALLSETGCEAAWATAERLRRAVEAGRAPVAAAPGGGLAVTISLGVTCRARADGLSVEG
ncbi:MAG: PAS domain S-box protein, partial [Desulfovibrionaceae bacterium]